MQEEYPTGIGQYRGLKYLQYFADFGRQLTSHAIGICGYHDCGLCGHDCRSRFPFALWLQGQDRQSRWRRDASLLCALYLVFDCRIGGFYSICASIMDKEEEIYPLYG